MIRFRGRTAHAGVKHIGSIGVVLALVLPGAAVASTTRTVRIEGIDFAPRTVSIRKGDAVTWRFLDGRTPHNVASTGSRRFRSSPTKQSGSYTVRFRKAGTYRYVCTIHFNMKAKVVVS